MRTPALDDVLDDAWRDRLADIVAASASDDAMDPITVTAPFTGETLGSVPRSTPRDVTEAVDRASTAQSEWVDRPVAERATIVDRVGELILDRRERFFDLIQAESGKARLDALEEVSDVCVTASYYADRAPSAVRNRSRTGAIPGLTATTEHRRPVGVVGLISPWNYPLTLTISDALPALAAGNAVVLKPASETPFTALAAAELLSDAGVPRDLFQVVTGDGPTVGEALVESVDFVGFTGSTAAGRRVAAIAGENLIDCSLELGGKNAAIVCDDAPIEDTVTGLLRGSFANAGQLCISIERIYVDEAVFDDFLDRFVERTAALELNRSFAFDADVGSLISAAQLERVEAHVEDAIERGATVETGGEARPGVGPLFYAPTVLSDVAPDSDLTCQETFGPVVRVEAVPDVETAVERANDSDYGLHASVWTGDAERGREIATRIDCGTVAVNDAYVSTWGSTDAPMGGMKESGLGRRHGRDGIAKYTESQTVAVQRGHPIARPKWLPRSLAASGFLAYSKALGWLRRRKP